MRTEEEVLEVVRIEVVARLDLDEAAVMAEELSEVI